MFRMVAIGVWACVVTLGSTFGVVYWKTHRTKSMGVDTHAAKLEIKKVKPITVPIISEGVLKGYISAEFAYVIDSSAIAPDAVEVDSFVMDEAFRRIYSDNSLDFQRIEKYDLNALTRELTKKINVRLGFDAIKETLVKSFAFVPKEDIPR